MQHNLQYHWIKVIPVLKIIHFSSKIYEKLVVQANKNIVAIGNMRSPHYVGHCCRQQQFNMAALMVVPEWCLIFTAVFFGSFPACSSS